MPVPDMFRSNFLRATTGGDRERWRSSPNPLSPMSQPPRVGAGTGVDLLQDLQNQLGFAMLITHNLAVAERTHQIMVMRDGEIVRIRRHREGIASQKTNTQKPARSGAASAY